MLLSSSPRWAAQAPGLQKQPPLSLMSFSVASFSTSLHTNCLCAGGISGDMDAGWSERIATCELHMALWEGWKDTQSQPWRVLLRGYYRSLENKDVPLR